MAMSMGEVQQSIIAFTYEQATMMAMLQQELGETIPDVESYASEQVADLLGASEEVAKDADWPEVIIYAFNAGMITAVCNLLAEALDMPQEQ